MNIEVYLMRIKSLDNALKCKGFIAGITWNKQYVKGYTVGLICIKL